MDRLPSDTDSLFAAAYDRLERRRPSAGALLEALALARGRGLPRVDRTWVSAASALNGGEPVTERDVDFLLSAGAPYIMLDAQHGQSVYRLAHRTFTDALLRRFDGALGGRHRLVVRGLVSTAVRVLPAAPNPYLVFHLAEHVAAALAWPELAETELLDHLDPRSIAAAVMSTGLGRDDVPAGLRAFALAGHLLGAASPGQRTTIRAVAAAQLSGATDAYEGRYNLGAAAIDWHNGNARSIGSVTFESMQDKRVVFRWSAHDKTFIGYDRSDLAEKRFVMAVEPADPGRWAGALRWARLRRASVHTLLVGHVGAVRAVAAVGLADGRSLVASGGDDATVRLWDAATGSAAGNPLLGHQGPVRAVAAAGLVDGRSLVVSGGDDGTVRLWDAATGSALGDPLTGHEGAVWAVAAIGLVDGNALVVSGGADGTARLWDATAGTVLARWEPPSRARPPAMARQGGVRSVAWDAPDGRLRVLICHGVERQVFGRRKAYLWDPLTRPHEPAPDDVFSPTWSAFRDIHGTDSVSSVIGPGGARTLASFVAYFAPEVTLWHDADDRSTFRAGDVFAKPTQFAAMAAPDDTLVLATAESRKIKLWRRASSDDTFAAGDTLTAHTGEVLALAAVPLADDRFLLASASEDGTVRLWDLTEPATPDEDGPSSESDAVVDIRALAATSVSVVPAGGRVLLSTGARDETAHCWDAAAGTTVTGPLHGQPLPKGHGQTTWFTDTMATAGVAMPDGRQLVATGSGRTLQLWDPLTGAAVGPGRSIRRLPRIPLDRASHLNRIIIERSRARSPITAITTATLADSVVLLIVAAGRTVLRQRVTSDGRFTRAGGRSVRHQARVRALAVNSPTTGASAGDDATIRFWDLGTGTVAAVGTGHEGPVRALTSIAGRFVSGGDDGTIRQWEPVTGTQLAEPLPAHAGPVRALAAVELPGQPPLLASSGDDGYVKLWHPVDGEPAGAIPLDLRIASLAARDGVLYAAGSDGLLALDVLSLQDADED